MNLEDFDHTLKEYVRERVVFPEDAMGCSHKDIESIKKAQDIHYLPSVYLGFLKLFGRSAGGLFQGSDYAYEDLLTLKDEARRSMSWEEPPLQMPQGAFVFLGNQGVHFLYFLISDGDDPPVFSYVESEKPQKIYDYLSEFYFKKIDRAKHW